MKILALETSAVVASVALLDASRVLAQYSIHNKMTHSENLMPMIQSMMAQVKITPSELEYIALAAGPGSFTGLRIGSATAKGLAHALNLPIIEVPTLEALAYNGCVFDGYLVPMMDARRGQVYTGIYERRETANRSNPIVEPLITSGPMTIEQIADCVKRLPVKSILLLGDGVAANLEGITTYFESIDYQLASPQITMQNAASVGLIAVAKIELKAFKHYRDHQPDYMRMSQAERELKEKSR